MRTCPDAEHWAQREIESLRQQLETERMRNVACDVVAMADTPSSAEEARKMLPEYQSAALESVIRRVDECIALRQQLAASQVREVMLREALWNQRNDCINFNGGELTACIMESSTKALAATDDLSDYILCKKEPVGYMFQHEDTGRTMCVEAQQVEGNFEKNNPRLFKVGPLYSVAQKEQGK